MKVFIAISLAVICISVYIAVIIWIQSLDNSKVADIRETNMVVYLSHTINHASTTRNFSRFCGGDLYYFTGSDKDGKYVRGLSCYNRELNTYSYATLNP